MPGVSVPSHLALSPPHPPHTPPSPVGVRLSGHTAHHLGRGYRLPVRLTCDPQPLFLALGHLAPRLWPLASHHGGFPLL